MHTQQPSPFDAVEEAFGLLVPPPAPLSLDGAAVGHGWPARAIPLDELRSRLLHPSTPYAARDGALNAVVVRARTEGGPLLVGLAGVLLPGLRRAVAPLAKVCPEATADLEAEMLAGLVEAVRRWHGDKERAAMQLIWAAYRRARGFLADELAYRSLVAPPPAQGGHPDLVLADAVRAGIITAAEAELIGATRLGDVSLRQLAGPSKTAYDALQKQRRRAELALVAWISSKSSVRDRPKTHGYGDERRPREGRGHRQPEEAPPTSEPRR